MVPRRVHVLAGLLALTVVCAASYGHAVDVKVGRNLRSRLSSTGAASVNPVSNTTAVTSGGSNNNTTAAATGGSNSNTTTATRNQIKAARQAAGQATDALRAASERLEDAQRLQRKLELKSQEIAASLQRKQQQLKRIQDNALQANSHYLSAKNQSDAHKVAFSVSKNKLDKVHYRDKARARRMLQMLVKLERKISHHFKVAEAITLAKQAFAKEKEYWQSIHKTMVELPKLKRQMSDVTYAASRAQSTLKLFQEKVDRLQRAMAELLKRQATVAQKSQAAKAAIPKAQAEVDALKADLVAKKQALDKLRT